MPIWALAFWYGAQLVANGEIDFGQLLNALMAIIFGNNLLFFILFFSEFILLH